MLGTLNFCVSLLNFSLLIFCISKPCLQLHLLLALLTSRSLVSHSPVSAPILFCFPEGCHSSHEPPSTLSSGALVLPGRTCVPFTLSPAPVQLSHWGCRESQLCPRPPSPLQIHPSSPPASVVSVPPQSLRRASVLPGTSSDLHHSPRAPSPFPDSLILPRLPQREIEVIR